MKLNTFFNCVIGNRISRLPMGPGAAMAMVVLSLTAFLNTGTVLAEVLTPRQALAKPATVSRPDFDSILTVKFADQLKVRARGGKLSSPTNVDLTAVKSINDFSSLSFEPLLLMPESRLASLEERAARQSGVAQPDLAGMMIVRGPEEKLESAARALLSLEQVEWVNFSMLLPEPPCTDLSPATPNYYASGLQGYHNPDPGVNMNYAWALGARGQAVKISDCEYGYITGTEDLCNIFDEPGQTVHPDVATLGFDDHGTAVLGEIGSLDNNYGCTGLAPDSNISFFSEWTVQQGLRRTTAIAEAIDASRCGDVVLLEMQIINFGNDYGPAELDPAVWTVTKTGTDAGVIVVGAAGNGNQNLDSATYATYLSWGDSGAIIVGAGSADSAHQRLSFSTYGNRVNVQGWGTAVFTLGYGSYATLGNDRRQRYTSGFNGTSSASPIVTSCVAVLQSLAQSTLGCRIGPRGMRQLLINTGTPQQGSGSGHIGPLPDMEAACNVILAEIDCHVGGYMDGCADPSFPVILTGPGPDAVNSPLVRTWNAANISAGWLQEWTAYGVDMYGVNLASGNLNIGGGSEIITGAGPGAVFGPHVRAFDMMGTPVSGVSFLAYGTNKFGVNVAAGDLDSDGFDEIITGAGPGAVFGPHVRAWDVDNGTAAPYPGVSFFAYGAPKYGVNVATGDIDGDGFWEIVTGAGPGTIYGPHVRGWDVDGSSGATPISGVSFLAYGTNQFGVNITCGDLDGDGIGEIITGPGPGVVFGPHVRAWSYDGVSTTPLSTVNFFAYSSGLYGVSVSAFDVDFDGFDEILTMPGPDAGSEARVRAWNVDGAPATLIGTMDFDAYSDKGYRRGGRVAGGYF